MDILLFVKEIHFIIKTYPSRKTSVVSESESEVAQSCPTLCDPADCSLLGSSVHGVS